VSCGNYIENRSVLLSTWLIGLHPNKAFSVSVKPHLNERLYTHTQSKNERNSLFIFHILPFFVSLLSTCPYFPSDLHCFPLLLPLATSFLLVTCPSVCDILGERHVYRSQGTTKAALSFRASPQSSPLKTLNHHTLITKA